MCLFDQSRMVITLISLPWGSRTYYNLTFIHFKGHNGTKHERVRTNRFKHIHGCIHFTEILYELLW